MYFSLVNDKLIDSDIVIREPGSLPVEYDFMGGAELELPSAPLEFTTNAQGGDELPDFYKGTFTVMSKKFFNIFRRAGVDNIQEIPIVIKSETDGTVWMDHVGANILGVIACVNFGKSSYDEIMPGHYIFSALAIDAEKANGVLMFRLEEHLPTILMHKSVGKFIMDEDPDETITGWDADEIEQ